MPDVVANGRAEGLHAMICLQKKTNGQLRRKNSVIALHAAVASVLGAFRQLDPPQIFQPTQQKAASNGIVVDKPLHIHSVRCAETAFCRLVRFLSNFDASPIQCFSNWSVRT